MKNKFLILSLCFVAILMGFQSCEEDDGPVVTITIRDRAEQQVDDKDSIVSYLSSHYYNSSFFETGSNHKYTDIVITELDEGESVPDGHTLLINDVDIETTEFLEVEYEYYILKLNQGGGKSPNFTDAVRMRYEGSSVNNEDNIFDSTITPIELNLQGNGFTTFGTIRAWQLIIPEFNSALDFSFDNGIVNYTNFGLGVMFVPSGLAYFSGSTTGSSYDNLIFKFELLQMEQLDHDNDGIPSYLEDVNNNIDVSDDDTDEDVFPNYIDLDDDEDGVSTFDELTQTIYTVDTNLGEEEPVLGDNEYEFSRTVTSGVIKITTVKALDTDGNDKLDHLDSGVSINYNETDE